MYIKLFLIKNKIITQKVSSKMKLATQKELDNKKASLSDIIKWLIVKSS